MDFAVGNHDVRRGLQQALLDRPARCSEFIEGDVEGDKIGGERERPEVAGEERQLRRARGIGFVRIAIAGVGEDREHRADFVGDGFEGMKLNHRRTRWSAAGGEVTQKEFLEGELER